MTDTSSLKGSTSADLGPIPCTSGITWAPPDKGIGCIPPYTVLGTKAPEDKPKTFITIDLETTGLIMEKHGICQIGAWATGENEDDFKDYFVLDVNPHLARYGEDERRVKVDQGALDVNGFTHERIDDGTPLIPAMVKFLTWMNRWKDDTDIIIVGQNTAFDIAWLKRDFYRYGLDTGIFRRNVDLYTLSFLKYGMPMGLAKLADKEGIRNRGAHDALADAYTTSKLFHRLSKQLKKPKIVLDLGRLY